MVDGRVVARSDAELLGQKVRQLRYRKGLTQARLAERAGVGEKTLKRLELGKTDTPHPETLAAIAGALGLRPEELFEAASMEGDKRQAALPALHQLPRPPRNLTGRGTELATLLEQARGGGAPVLSIHGMGGIGKTALALKVAEELSLDFPDGQFYLDLCGASDPTPTVDAMLHVIRSIEPQRRLPTSDAEVEAAYRTVLRGKRCLLLMDNVSGREQVDPLLPPEGNLLLLTSRRRFALPGEYGCALAPLADADSHLLIRSLAPHAEAVFERLAGACGGLPLALSLAGRALSERPDLDPVEYANRLTDDSGRLKQLDAAQSDGGVEASFSLSYEMLDEDDQRGLCALSVCPQHFDRRAAAAIWGLNLDAADTRIGRLVRLNLLESSGTGSAARYRLHDLVRLFAADRLPPAQRIVFAMRHAHHFLGMLAEAERTVRDEEGQGLLSSLELLDREWVHVQAAFAFCRDRGAEDAGAAALCRNAPEAFSLLRLRLPPERRIDWCTVAIDMMRRYDQTGREGRVMVDIARAHQELGDPRQAIAFAKRALALSEARGDGRTQTSALVALSDAYHALGAPREAIEFGERGLNLAVHLGERSEQALALIVLGWSYRLMGELRRAVESCERALPIARDLGDRAAESAVLLALAFALRGHDDRGRECAIGSLEIAREIGDRRVEGYSLIALGDAQEGDERYQESLEIAREVGDRRMEGHALLAIGITLVRSGRGREALERLVASHAIAVETGDRSMESMVLAALGATHLAVGELLEAVDLLVRDEALANEMGNRRQAALAAWFLSQARERQGELGDAVAAAERAGEYARQTDDAPIGNVERRLLNLRTKLDERGR